MIANLLKILKSVMHKIVRCTVLGKSVLRNIDMHRQHLAEYPSGEQYIVFTFDASGILRSVRYSNSVFDEDPSAEGRYLNDKDSIGK